MNSLGRYRAVLFSSSLDLVAHLGYYNMHSGLAYRVQVICEHTSTCDSGTSLVSLLQIAS